MWAPPPRTWKASRSHTRFVTGLHRRPGEFGGDPSPKTALGVYLGIKAAAKFRLGRTDLDGLRVAVQGVGGVGYHLCRLLAAEGAKLRVADVRADAVSARSAMNSARSRFPSKRCCPKTSTWSRRARSAPC